MKDPITNSFHALAEQIDTYQPRDFAWQANLRTTLSLFNKSIINAFEGVYRSWSESNDGVTGSITWDMANQNPFLGVILH